MRRGTSRCADQDTVGKINPMRTLRTSDMPGSGEMPYSCAPKGLFGAFCVAEPHPDVAEFPRCHSDVREVEPPGLLECAQRLFRCARCHLSWRWRKRES
jgi:hypothetical protein